MADMLNDPLIASPRGKYSKKGPNPKGDINKWAQNYLKRIDESIRRAEEAIKCGKPVDVVCRETGLREDTVAMLAKGKKPSRARKRDS